ncbi:MAG: Fe-S cluster assembly protein SufD [Bacteroidales bacterium]|nr:Fe-S cluster assembly protein SufD [Candidatus Physcousia equi]
MEQQYIDIYRQERETICQHAPEVLNAVRDVAFDDFCRLGFPSQKVERYRYTHVAEAFAPNYGLNLQRLRFQVNPYDVFKCDVPNLSTSLYFVVNDQVLPASEQAPTLPEGVIVDSFCRVAADRPELISRYYGKLAQTGQDAINALNTMLCQDGLLVYVPKDTVVERPVQVVNVLRSTVDLMANRRVLVVLEEGASIRLLCCDHALDEVQFLSTQVTEVFVGERAHLELYELEETHTGNRRFANLYAELQSQASATLDSITLHNGQTRNRADVVLAGAGAEARLNGLVIADKQQRVDNNTLIDHRAERCQSQELYKYVLDGEARCAFAGKILVREGAQQTVSQETNANLLGSPDAHIFTQPMLEIYADDVKCNHGSTVGQLGDATLFYMRQRGIPLEEARMLLKFAFAADVLQTIHLDPLRDRLHYLVDKRFRGELTKCEGCKMCKA